MQTTTRCLLSIIALIALLSIGCRREAEISPHLAASKATCQGAQATEIYNDGGVHIRRESGDSGAMVVLNPIDGTFKGRGELFRIIALLSPGLIRDNRALPDGTFSVSVDAPGREMGESELRERAWKRLTKAYERAFKVSIHRVMRTEDVLVLRILDRGLPGMQRARESHYPPSGTSTRGYEFRGYTFAQVADFLFEMLGAVVVDETNDKAAYRFEAPIAPDDLFHLHDADVWSAALKKVGLDLRKMPRKIEYTVIEKAPAGPQLAPMR